MTGLTNAESLKMASSSNEEFAKNDMDYYSDEEEIGERIKNAAEEPKKTETPKKKRKNRHNNRKKKAKAKDEGKDTIKESDPEGNFASSNTPNAAFDQTNHTATLVQSINNVWDSEGKPASYKKSSLYEIRFTTRPIPWKSDENKQDAGENTGEKEDDDVQIEENTLFATSPIAAGTRIISETPIFTLPANATSMNDIYSAFLTLELAEQAAFMTLTGAAPLKYHETTVVIETLIDEYLPLRSRVLSGAQVTKHEVYVYKELRQRIPLLIRGWRVTSRFVANSFSLTNLNPEERDGIPSNAPVTGVFLTVGRLAHSCIPNCLAAWNPVTGRMNVHTTRAIVPDEQLTISAIGNGIWYEDHDTRTDLLADNAVFNCICPACDSAHPNYQQNAILRAKLNFNTTTLCALLTRIDANKNPTPYEERLEISDGINLFDFASMNVSANTVNDVADYREAERKLLDNISLLQELGCADTELPRWRTALSNIVYPRFGQLDKALAQAKAAFAEAVMCWGKDHPDIGPLERGLKAAERNVENRLKEKEKDQAEMRKKLMEKGKVPGRKRK